VLDETVYDRLYRIESSPMTSERLGGKMKGMVWPIESWNEFEKIRMQEKRGRGGGVESDEEVW
jgi:hypothetical protein